jgi:uncharacterized membrane protein YesL
MSSNYRFMGKLSHYSMEIYKYIEIQLRYMEFRDIIYIIIAIILAVILFYLFIWLLPIIIIIIIALIIYALLKGRDRYG